MAEVLNDFPELTTKIGDKEVDIMKRYKEKFKAVLSIKKVAQLFKAEMDFKKKLMQLLVQEPVVVAAFHLEAQGILRNKIPLNSATMLLVAPKLYYFLNCATAYSVVTNADMHYFALNKTAHHLPLVLW